MPLSNRRRARRKEIQLQETSDAEAPDSSPTRPSNKKRKVGYIQDDRRVRGQPLTYLDGPPAFPPSSLRQTRICR